MDNSLLHFPIDVARLLEARGFSQRELARRCGFTVCVVGDILAGQRCSVSTLQAITTHLAETEAERYNLACCHLRDEAVRAGFDPTHLVIRHVDGADINALDLSPQMNAYIGLIAREAAHNKAAADLVEVLGDFILHLVALRADAESARPIPFPHADSSKADVKKIKARNKSATKKPARSSRPAAAFPSHSLAG